MEILKWSNKGKINTTKCKNTHSNVNIDCHTISGPKYPPMRELTQSDLI